MSVAVQPGNVKIAVESTRYGSPVWQQVLVWGRIPLQWPLVALALRAGQRREGLATASTGAEHGSYSS